MNKREREAFQQLDSFLADEWDRRAGSHGARHPYIAECRKAATSLRTLRDAIERHRALAAKWKAKRKSK